MAWRWARILGWAREYITNWPRRWVGLLRWLLWLDRPRGSHAIIRWFAGLVCNLADLTPLAWAAESLFLLSCSRCRPLLPEERDIAVDVLGRGLDPDLLVIKMHSSSARRVGAWAYVSFHTIHVARDIPASLLVHELVHCRQYRAIGSRYIPEALWAQRWGGGYDFGGQAGLARGLEAGGLLAFNVEQQAAIIESWYRTLPEPGDGSRDILELYRRDLDAWPG